jgi:hypothetical protein
MHPVVSRRQFCKCLAYSACGIGAHLSAYSTPAIGASVVSGLLDRYRGIQRLQETSLVAANFGRLRIRAIVDLLWQAPDELLLQCIRASGVFAAFRHRAGSVSFWSPSRNWTSGLSLDSWQGALRGSTGPIGRAGYWTASLLLPKVFNLWPSLSSIDSAQCVASKSLCNRITGRVGLDPIEIALDARTQLLKNLRFAAKGVAAEIQIVSALEFAKRDYYRALSERPERRVIVESPHPR